MPNFATVLGIPGRDGQCTDYSPAAHHDRADLYRSTLASLQPHLNHHDPFQAFAAKVLTGWLEERLREHEAGEWKRDLNHIYSPFQDMRDVFDVMPRERVEDWDNIVSRLSGFPEMLGGYRESLQVGIQDGDTVAARQVESLIEQLQAVASEESRFAGFPKEAAGVGADSVRVQTAVDVAKKACADSAGWLIDNYLPVARPTDPVGRDQYMLNVDKYLGTSIDLEETYDWGWSEVHRIRREMDAIAREIDRERSLADVIDLLDTDPDRSAATREEFVSFVSDIQQQAIGQLSGAHFDVPDELRAITVNIAPPGGSLGAWYVSPSEDFSRPGSIWYAPGERERLPYWQEVSTAYHEGFPGHHLQVGTSVLEREKLSRFQRMAIWYAGYTEGWALYAERLMDELGYFEKPDYRLGLLASQLFRAVRVVVDIGCQLEFRIPDDAPLHAGDIFDYERAVDYMEEIGLHPRDISESEVTRYLGWSGQAISYKVGEREILDIRDRLRARGEFHLKDFHRRVLELGEIRLDHLRERML